MSSKRVSKPPCQFRRGSIIDKPVPDIAGPIENAVAEADDDYNCNAYLCRGYQFEDNSDNVKVVKGGDVLYFHIDLIAGHHPGYAVSPCSAS